MRRIEGLAMFLGDDIDTDVIIPGRFLRTLDYNELAQHVLEGISPEASRYARNCSILVAGENFGCGSSREQAPLAIKFAGIQCVVAKSYARIFYRNAINIGLLVLEYEGDFELDDCMDVSVIVDPDNKVMIIEGNEILLKPLPDHAQEIIDHGGLINYYKKKKRDLDPAPAVVTESFDEA